MSIFITDHKAAAVNVRSVGPRLFAALIAEKSTIDSLHPLEDCSRIYGEEKTFDRYAVLERRDLFRAIESGRYSGVELSVLRYLHANIHTVGERVGTQCTLSMRGGVTLPYSVLTAAHVEGYRGDLPSPLVRLGSAFLDAVCDNIGLRRHRSGRLMA